jgi:drug/metabolite transporter (DMT)-like permease
MPRSIAMFEKFAYLALILGICSALINFRVNAQFRGVTAVSAAIIQTLFTLFQILFIWLIARKKKNWARWLWIVVTIPGVATAVVANLVHPYPHNGAAGTAAFLLVYMMYLASGSCLLKADSRIWVRDSQPQINH